MNRDTGRDVLWRQVDHGVHDELEPEIGTRSEVAVLRRGLLHRILNAKYLERDFNRGGRTISLVAV